MGSRAGCFEEDLKWCWMVAYQGFDKSLTGTFPPLCDSRDWPLIYRGERKKKPHTTCGVEILIQLLSAIWGWEGRLLQRRVDLLKGHDRVAGNKDGIVFHPAAGFSVEP